MRKMTKQDLVLPVMSNSQVFFGVIPEDFKKLYDLIMKELDTSDDQKFLTLTQKSQLLSFLCGQWEKYRNAGLDQMYYLNAEHEPYRSYIKLATVLANDHEIIFDSYLTILMPLTANDGTLYKESLKNFDFDNTIYLENYLVTLDDIFLTFQMRHRLVNPFLPQSVLPAMVIDKFFNYLSQHDKEQFFQIIRPIVDSSGFTDSSILESLLETLQPARVAADDFGAGVVALQAFKAGYEKLAPIFQAEIASYNDPIPEKKISDFLASILDPSLAGTCLSEAANSICSILSLVIHAREVSRTYFDYTHPGAQEFMQLRM